MSGTTTIFSITDISLALEVGQNPGTMALLQNYPNPFNPETWIPYQLSEPAVVMITIYNVAGSVVPIAQSWVSGGGILS